MPRKDTECAVVETAKRTHTNLSGVPGLAMGGVGVVMATIRPHENGLREGTHVMVEIAKRTQSIVSTVPRVVIDGVGAFMTMITAHENDRSEETRLSWSKTAKTKPINYIDGSANRGRREWPC